VFSEAEQEQQFWRSVPAICEPTGRLLLLSEAEQLSLGSASANFCVAKAKRGLQEAEQLSLGSASAAKVRRRRNKRGLQEAEQKLSMRACSACSLREHAEQLLRSTPSGLPDRA